MSVELATLLDELARRHARGEPLDVEGLLAQAGDRSDELAPMIETFLVRAPRRVASAQALAYVRTLDDPPILRARVAKALRVDDVVDAIVERARSNRTLGRRSGATTSSWRAAFSIRLRWQLRSGTRSARFSDARASR